MTRTTGRDCIRTKQQAIAKLASYEPKLVLTTLAHHVDMEWLKEAVARTRKGGGVGVDGVTSKRYLAKLEENLAGLLEAFKSGLYQAPPVRRVHIPKGDGRGTRPIGIPTFEDKILQRAVLMLLEPIYEQDFLDCSHGFRPGRSCHTALSELRAGLMRVRGGWIIDLDIQSFFDAIDPAWLREFLDQRVRDGVLRRVLGKWMRAGVVSEGIAWNPETGTPQGGVISPLLANLYLHEVLDQWFEQMVKPRLRGRAFMVRFADDAVLVFEQEKDARKVMNTLPKRFEKYGLSLHPEKTRLLSFERPETPGSGGPGSFDFLGFTHYWGKSRKGHWVVMKKTASQRFSRAGRRIGQWCRRNRHLPVATQRNQLNAKLRGHDNYYGVIGNMRAISRFHRLVERHWRKWLSRRSQKAGTPWPVFQRLLRDHPLISPRLARRAKPT